MATTDTNPWIYDFRYNYYENFYRNRYQQFSTSGAFYDMFHQYWIVEDDTAVLNSVVINDGIDIKYYVQKNYNGDTPDCLVDKIVDAINDWFDSTAGIVVDIILGGGVISLIRVINKFISNFFSSLGSFICTATLKALEDACGQQLLNKLKTYLDVEVLSTKEGIEMFRYYTVLGPKIVEAVESDKDKYTVYKYIYAEYISRMSKLIDEGNKLELFNVYFRMLDDMATRYNIPTGKRFNEWLQNLTY